jgi:hypothetical protein
VYIKSLLIFQDKKYFEQCVGLIREGVYCRPEYFKHGDQPKNVLTSFTQLLQCRIHYFSIVQTVVIKDTSVSIAEPYRNAAPALMFNTGTLYKKPFLNFQSHFNIEIFFKTDDKNN